MWNKHSVVLHFKQKSGDNKADSLCQDTHTMMTRFTSFFSKIQYTNNCKTIIKISSNDNWSTLVANIKTFFCRAIAPTTQDQMMPRTASNRSRKRAGWHKSARNSPTSWVLSYSSLGRCLPGQWYTVGSNSKNPPKIKLWKFSEID